MTEYFDLPLFAVVVAAPWRFFPARYRLTAVALVLLLAAQASIFAARSALIAATWEARNPDLINEFVAAHVPPGSAVVGPEAPYFFPVERSGSRYRTISPRSWADWARWVPQIEPEALRVPRQFPIEPPRDRFFIWPVEDELPEEYACASLHVVATYIAPHGFQERLGPLVAFGDAGYPTTRLYHLPDGCPSGYDPTVPPPTGERSR